MSVCLIDWFGTRTPVGLEFLDNRGGFFLQTRISRQDRRSSPDTCGWSHPCRHRRRWQAGYWGDVPVLSSPSFVVYESIPGKTSVKIENALSLIPFVTLPSSNAQRFLRCNFVLPIGAYQWFPRFYRYWWKKRCKITGTGITGYEWFYPICIGKRIGSAPCHRKDWQWKQLGFRNGP